MGVGRGHLSQGLLTTPILLSLPLSLLPSLSFPALCCLPVSPSPPPCSGSSTSPPLSVWSLLLLQSGCWPSVGLPPPFLLPLPLWVSSPRLPPLLFSEALLPPRPPNLPHFGLPFSPPKPPASLCSRLCSRVPSLARPLPVTRVCLPSLSSSGAPAPLSLLSLSSSGRQAAAAASGGPTG